MKLKFFFWSKFFDFEVLKNFDFEVVSNSIIKYLV